MASGRDETKKEDVMKTLTELGASQEDIDRLYAQFGQKCLVSVEKFYEYSDIRDKKGQHLESRSSHYGRSRQSNESSLRTEMEERSASGNTGTAEEYCCRDGIEDEAKREEVMKTLMDFGTSQEDIDSLYAQFGKKCLVSVEKFYEYLDIKEKKSLPPKSRSRQARSSHDESVKREEMEETFASQNIRTTIEYSDEKKGRLESQVGVEKVGVPGDEDAAKWTYIGEADELKEHIEKYGLKNIRGLLQKNIDSWKQKPLNIAITGMSGKGKSSFINALLNKEPDDEGAAEVGELECTTVCREYLHPEHTNLVFWDVPGAGTPTFPKDTYLQDIKFDRYDFFMILSSERFSEIDSWLAKEIQDRDKRFYFVRTKIDIDMDGKHKRLKEKFNEGREFNKMKSLLHDQLAQNLGNNNFHLFMISNYHPNKYDFPNLLHQLLNDVPNEKKMTLAFGIAGLSKTLIEEKASALSSRIWKCALSSGVANMKLDELKKEVKFTTPESLFTADGLTKYVAKSATEEVAQKVAQYILPVIGIAVVCHSSYAVTMRVLQGILVMMKEDAINVVVYVTTRETEV